MKIDMSAVASRIPGSRGTPPELFYMPSRICVPDLVLLRNLPRFP